MSWTSMMMAMAVREADPAIGDAGDWVEITEDDVTAIRALVREQLTAFKAGDAEAAHALSSDAIHVAFPEPARLLEVIREHYPALAHPAGVRFGELILVPDGVAQVLEIRDDDGVGHHALYLLERTRQGRWTANGCLMASALREEAMAA